MNTKKIIALGVVVLFTGAQCHAAAQSEKNFKTTQEITIQEMANRLHTAPMKAKCEEATQQETTKKKEEQKLSNVPMKAKNPHLPQSLYKLRESIIKKEMSRAQNAGININRERLDALLISGATNDELYAAYQIKKQMINALL